MRVLLNIIILIALGVFAYSAALYFNWEKPQGPVSPPPAHKSGLFERGEAIPDFRFGDLNGRTYDIKSFDGKTIILNFWASWCAPCIKEFPDLLRLAETYEDSLVLIALSSDFDQGKIQRFIKKFEPLPGNVYIGHDKTGAITQGLFNTYQLPETYIIDSGHTIRRKLIGAGWDFTDIKAFIETL